MNILEERSRTGPEISKDHAMSAALRALMPAELSDGEVMMLHAIQTGYYSRPTGRGLLPYVVWSGKTSVTREQYLALASLIYGDYRGR